ATVARPPRTRRGRSPHPGRSQERAGRPRPRCCGCGCRRSGRRWRRCTATPGRAARGEPSRGRRWTTRGSSDTVPSV
ncbi:MAG: hypothetical protein AVDCRST_MAG66-1600, partial [uncultured Pseudonocardia sp.]